MKSLSSALVILIFISLLGSCNTSSKTISTDLYSNLGDRIQNFVSCHNNRDLDCLLDLYHEDYASFSPINRPISISTFIKNNLANLDKNNFEVSIQIKEIETGESQAFIAMDWQLRTKGNPKADDPFANVQRLDIWKKDTSEKWRIYRTIIYSERTF